MTVQLTDQMPLATASQMECGDRIAPFALPDHEGKLSSPLADGVAGRPALLVFDCGAGGDNAGYVRELVAMHDHANAFKVSGTVIFAITRRNVAENRQLRADRGFSFPVLSDPDGQAYRACGLDPVPPGHSTITLVVDPAFRAVRAIGDTQDGSHAAQALPDLSQLDQEHHAAPISLHPPVLVLPRTLTPADCARVIQVWHRPVPVWTSDGVKSEAFAKETGDFKLRNESYGRVLQFLVRDPQVQRYLDMKLRRRVIPEILKAFQSKVSRREDYRIAGYDSAEGGVLPAHRDNSTPQTAQRRFTLSVTLNAEEFSGGALRFPEYGGQEYNVPTGTAVIWSCALLHEVLPVTAGRRFILGTHLFGT
jgi:peroxiredoxin/predicted 2-oxoglutarate/Fe(II)-dependent dioxygenase YbiX